MRRIHDILALHIIGGSAITIERLLGTILSDCQRDLAAARQTFCVQASAESVHQMRVALRRLRAALKMFSRACPSPAFADWAGRADALATALAEARACDVLNDLAREPLASATCPSGAAEWMSAMDVFRTEAYRRAADGLDHADVDAFIALLNDVIAARAWRNPLSEDERAALHRPAASFAKNALGRLFRKACKRGKRLGSLSVEERHAFRIALKNLRYACALFAPVCARPNAVRRWTNALAGLQDALGLQHDLAGAPAIMERVAAPAPAIVTEIGGFVLGWHARDSEDAERKIVAEWKRLRRADPFWR